MEISDIIKKMVETQEITYSCVATVTSIDSEKRLIDVQPNDGAAEIFDVRLQSVVSGTIGLVLWPKIGSEVIVTFLSKEIAYAALYGEIEKVEISIGSMALLLDAENANIDVLKSVQNINETTVTGSKLNTNVQTVKTVSTGYEVQASNMKLDAVLMQLIAGALNVQAVSTFTGATTFNGATAINGAITLNGGGNGGVPLSTPLSTEINKIITDIAVLKAKFDNWAPVANDGGAALKSQLAGWTPGTATITPEEISNPEITQ